MRKLQIFATILGAILLSGIVLNAQAGPPLQKCAIQPLETRDGGSQRQSRPECGLELTCTDKPVLLGNSQGVCFRATCPGIWGLIHTRADQASFRRRFFTYRHYAFRGYWDLKDQGVIETGAAPIRELFLVLPEDLIEFRLNDPDCYARVEIKKLGYIKTGNLCELQEWLAYNSYLEKAELNNNSNVSCPVPLGSCSKNANWLDHARGAAVGGLFTLGRKIGLPWPGN
ncbi:hypothetical protein [Desulfomonile tiedjei]|uniref:Uncharacterized protein n=1 Tax=Desulfomonile tiedjei (strain ATCC 49306 / DSM 6799 / DCB-1) TaxID=706587 RepID=I4C8X0_DESTA|nr:hypothetical protein [Desulfomonile tiedjei]AFM26011.1 hypothetical protein Desti_3355 [Desulfomonile tiedjei DSM 6799]